MTATKNKQALKNKRKREGTGRKAKTVIEKAHKLGKHPGVDVAVFICNRGRYSTYSSVDRESWPPTMAEIVSKAGISSRFLTDT